MKKNMVFQIGALKDLNLIFLTFEQYARLGPLLGGHISILLNIKLFNNFIFY